MFYFVFSNIEECKKEQANQSKEHNKQKDNVASRNYRDCSVEWSLLLSAVIGVFPSD